MKSSGLNPTFSCLLSREETNVDGVKPVEYETDMKIKLNPSLGHVEDVLYCPVSVKVTVHETIFFSILLTIFAADCVEISC